MSYLYGYDLATNSGAPKKERFSSARVMRTLYEKMTTDDLQDATRRSKIRKVYNGFLPYNQEALKRQGLKAITNVNFLGLRGIVEARATNILRLAQDTTPLVELVPMAKELAGPDADNISRIIAEEFSAVLRQSGRFIPALAMINKEADLYGIGPVTWASDRDFLPLALERGQLRFLRTGSVASNEHDLFMFETTMPASYLFFLVDHEDEARANGWDIKAVKHIIVESFVNNRPSHNQPDNESSTTPVEEALSELRRNGGFETYQFEEVKVINAFVREMAPPFHITQYMIPGLPMVEDNDESFLYKKHDAYENMDQCMLWFPYSVTERYASEVRGLATYLLPIEDVKNRIHSALCDATLRASSFILNRKGGGRSSELSITETGPYTIIDADLAPVQSQVSPKLQEIQLMAKMLTDLGNSTVTGMNELPMVRDDKQYSPSTRQTKAMVQEQEDTRARHEEALFVQRMAMLDKLFNECFRRFMNLVRKPFDAAYYPEVELFLSRCKFRGLPRKVILEAEKNLQIRTSRDLIMGSEGKSGFLMELLAQLGGSLDEEGRRSAVRDIVALRLGSRSADRYTATENRDQQPTDSSSFATQENNAMQNLMPAQVGSDQLHWSHIPVHAQVLQQISDQVQQGQVEEPQKTLSVMEAVSQHIQEHLQYGSQQIGMEAQAKEVAAMLRGLVSTSKALNLLVSRQEAVEQAEQEKAQREREDLERRANENELNAAKYKADKEAEIARYKEDKLHEARMEGLRLRGEETAAKNSALAAKMEAETSMRSAESEAKIEAARKNSAAMAQRLQQRSNIAGSTAPAPGSFLAAPQENPSNVSEFSL